MLEWPSISCTARKSPDDCSTCEANEWRSTCGCTFAGISVASACAFRRSCSTRGEMRVARVLKNRAALPSAAGGRTPSQVVKATSAALPTGTLRILLPLPVTMTSKLAMSSQPSEAGWPFSALQ